MQTTIIREQFDLANPCITIKEVRWILHCATQRYSAFYTFCLLAASAGLRCDELLNLTVYNFSEDFSSMNYVVDKPKTTNNGTIKTVYRKHRRVVLDIWVAEEVRQYVKLHFCKITTKDGEYYHSPYHDKKPNRRGQTLSQKMFPWSTTAVVDVMFYKLRKLMAKNGFDSMRIYRLATTSDGERPTYVVRCHALRKFALTIHYYKNGGDLKESQAWIKHTKSQTTDGYVFSAEQIGATKEWLATASYAEIFGYDALQRSITQVLGTAQTLLEMFD